MQSLPLFTFKASKSDSRESFRPLFRLWTASNCDKKVSTENLLSNVGQGPRIRAEVEANAYDKIITSIDARVLRVAPRPLTGQGVGTEKSFFPSARWLWCDQPLADSPTLLTTTAPLDSHSGANARQTNIALTSSTALVKTGHLSVPSPWPTSAISRS